MKLAYITLSVVAGLVTFFITGSLFSEYAPKFQPDGIAKAYVGLLIIAPACTAIMTTFLVKKYRQHSQSRDKLKKVMLGIVGYTGILIAFFVVIVANA